MNSSNSRKSVGSGLHNSGKTDGKSPPIAIRDIELVSEMRDVEELQAEVWGCNDRDIVPLTIIVATIEVGAILIGAFDGSSLVGFAYSFPGLENEHAVQHSHMLAVKPEYRNLNLGYQLKLAQRERARARNVTRMTWTFDPLQSLNAHFNFAKLAVVADSYKPDFYGETSSSILHQVGTDRLWVSWLLDSRRVRERLQAGATSKASVPDLERIVALVQVGEDYVPRKNEAPEVLGQEQLLVEIPADINALQHESPELAAEWRTATRWAFTRAIASEYLVEEFYRSSRKKRAIGVYLLSHGKRVEAIV